MMGFCSSSRRLGSACTMMCGGSAFVKLGMQSPFLDPHDSPAFRTLITTTSLSEHPHLPANLLAILEGLNTFPTEKEELNTWWVSELGAKPPKPKPSKNTSAGADDMSSDEEPDREGDEADDDWRKFFEDDAETSKDSKTKTPTARLHKLTIHQSLHSLPSHRAVFTRAWLALLPKLSSRDVDKSKSLAIRALNVMHRGVMPHLTRPVLIMDWVGGCVDHGLWFFFYPRCHCSTVGSN